MEIGRMSQLGSTDLTENFIQENEYFKRNSHYFCYEKVSVLMQEITEIKKTSVENKVNQVLTDY